MIAETIKSSDLSSLLPDEVAAVYLYGSAVKDRLREESDVDSAILSSHAVAEEERLSLISKTESIIDKLLRAKGVKREISVLDLRGKFVSVTLQYKVVTEGVLLYERDPLERMEFENAVKREYFDFVPFLRFLRKKKYGHILEKV